MDHTIPNPAGGGDAQPISGPAVARVLLAGDTHGNTSWWQTLIRVARRNGCDTILQLGDFGLWPAKRLARAGNPAGLDIRYLGHIARLAAGQGVRIRFVDGNHDDHPRGRALYPADGDGIRPIVDGVLDWADRGARWEWHGVRFGALGGAVSSDRFHTRSPRTAGVNWWPTEVVTDADVARLGDAKLDVLVTHDVPAGARLAADAPEHPVLAAETFEHRDRLRRAVTATRPELLVHGHHHTRLTDEIVVGENHVVRVEGIADDTTGTGASWAVLDLATLDVVDGVELQRARHAELRRRRDA